MTEQHALHIRAIREAITPAAQAVTALWAILRPDPEATRTAIRRLAEERRRQMPRNEPVSAEELEAVASLEYAKQQLPVAKTAYRAAQQATTAARATRDTHWQRLRHPVPAAPVATTFGDSMPVQLELIHRELLMARLDREFTGRPLPELLTALQHAEAQHEDVQAAWLSERLEQELKKPISAETIAEMERKKAEQGRVQAGLDAVLDRRVPDEVKAAVAAHDEALGGVEGELKKAVQRLSAAQHLGYLPPG